VRNVPILRREQFDAIESDAASTGDYAAAAQLMSELAATGTQSAEMPRAEAFLRAGEQWLLADNPARAAEDFRHAIDVGGPVSADPRVPLTRALFQLGEADEAQGLLSQVQAEGPVDPRTCDLLAELLAEQSDLPGALDWATAGVELRLAGAGAGAEAGQDDVPAVDGDDRELRMLLRLRFRIRNDLGLPEDEYDAMLDDS
jgi:predicted Zn-dependent protease